HPHLHPFPTRRSSDLYLRHRTASRAERGRDSFVPVGWDEALELVSEALLDTRERLGNESIYGGSYGWASAGRLHHAPSVLKRFLDRKSTRLNSSHVSI